MSVLETAIGWLAPPQCVGCGRVGKSLCLACSASEILPYGERCWNCGAISPRCRTCPRCQRLGGPRFLWISTNYEGLAKDLLRRYKFGQQRVAAKSIAKLMAEALVSFNSNADIIKMNYLIVPVPTATSRVRQRGFDHAGLLAQEVSRLLNLPTRRALIRLGQSRQLGAPRSVRLKQLEASYQVRRSADISDRNILLVDDVLTTGGTLRSAAKSLRKAGARRVDALVFAKRL